MYISGQPKGVHVCTLKSRLTEKWECCSGRCAEKAFVWISNCYISYNVCKRDHIPVGAPRVKGLLGISYIASHGSMEVGSTLSYTGFHSRGVHALVFWCGWAIRVTISYLHVLYGCGGGVTSLLWMCEDMTCTASVPCPPLSLRQGTWPVFLRWMRTTKTSWYTLRVGTRGMTSGLTLRVIVFDPSLPPLLNNSTPSNGWVLFCVVNSIECQSLV